MKQKISDYVTNSKIWFFLAFAVGLLAYIRLFFSIDVTDETIYLALPYGFSLGYKAFIQESALYQGSGFLLTPLAMLFRAIVGGPDGFMIFFRQLYFLTSLVLTVMFWKTMRKQTQPAIAALCAIFFICFVPFSIPSLSYNTFTGFLFCLSCFLAYHATTDTKVHKLPLISAIVALGCAVFSYPSLLFVSIFWPIFILVGLDKDRRRQAYLPLGIGALICLAAAGLLVAIVTPARLMEMLQFQLSFNVQIGGLNKIISLIYQFKNHLPIAIAMLVIPILCIYGLWRFAILRYFVYIALPAVFVVMYYLTPNVINKAHFFVEQLAFASVILCLTQGQKIAKKLKFFLVYLPALAGVAVAYTSSSAMASGGCFLILPASLCIPLICMIWKDRVTSKAYFNALSFFAALILVVGFYEFVYRDDKVWELDSSVESGAFKYIKTAKVKKYFLETLQNELKKVPKAAKTIMFFDDFPGGYLMTDLKPLTSALLVTSRKHYKYDREVFASYFRKPENQADVVIQMKEVVIYTWAIYDFTGDPEDPINMIFNNPPYRAVYENQYFIMHVKNNIPIL